MTEALYFTNNQEANELIAADPLALLIGFVLDQQITVQTAFAGPLKLKQRLGGLDASAIAAAEPERLRELFREKPAIHRFPGSMAKRVQELAAVVAEEYGGDAGRIWGEAESSDELARRLHALPGFGEMKVRTLASVLARRLGVAIAEPLAPTQRTLGDVDSPEALLEYQAAKRAKKAALRAAGA
ncbi:MAG TPA: HhH-GPD-type base excision DNA repair protein [Gaiellaceae bacterium]|nr:HhH-GPD-type base excision DNA repair protein [Gaiellaceae bacterium]